jgi:hypothetical protein
MSDPNVAAAPIQDTPAPPPAEPVAPAAPETPPVPDAPVPDAPPIQPPVPDPVPPTPPIEEPPKPVELKPEDYKLPEGITREVADFAHKNKLTQEQLDSTLTQFGEVIKQESQKEQQALRSLGEAQLKNWGDRADYNLTLAKRALKQNDPDGSLTKALNDTGYGNHPAVLNFLFNLGKTMQEGGFLKSNLSAPGTQSLAEKMFGKTHTT